MDHDHQHHHYSGSSNFSRPHRPGTPSGSTGRNPFDGGVDSQSSHRPTTGSGHDPFASPNASRPPSSFDSSGPSGRFGDQSQRFFHSRRVKKGEVEKPWTKNADPKEKWVTILPLIGIFVGFGISGFLVWDGFRSVVKHQYCAVLEDDFSRGLDPSVWEKEVQLGGFG